VGFFDRLDHDARRRQGTRFFGQSATERFHELVVDLLAAVLSQQLAHFDNVVFVAAALIRPLLEHVGPARRPTWPAYTWWAPHTHARGTHAWPCRSRTHRSTGRPRAHWSARTIGARVYAAGWRRELGLELAGLTPTAATRTAAAWTAEAATGPAARIAA
jgi:hypothetical protein